MVKRTLIALSLLLIVGAGVLLSRPSVHASAQPMTSPTTVQATSTANASEQPETASDTAADNDASAACSTDASGNQTGDCQNSQNASGSDNTGGTNP
jgi:hypothetical protein